MHLFYSEKGMGLSQAVGGKRPTALRQGEYYDMDVSFFNIFMPYGYTAVRLEKGR